MSAPSIMVFRWRDGDVVYTAHSLTREFVSTIRFWTCRPNRCGSDPTDRCPCGRSYEVDDTIMNFFADSTETNRRLVASDAHVGVACPTSATRIDTTT